MSSALGRTAWPAAAPELAGAVHCTLASDPEPDRFSATPGACEGWPEKLVINK